MDGWAFRTNVFPRIPLYAKEINDEMLFFSTLLYKKKIAYFIDIRTPNPLHGFNKTTLIGIFSVCLYLLFILLL
jgi:hypothetical protein